MPMPEQSVAARADAVQGQPPASPVILKSKYLALSFFLPFAILGTAFALNRVYPFGDGSMIIYDFKQQYYPFLSDLWHKFREGSIASWSWTAGLGHDYIALISYYMASPLNLLAMLAPHAWLREMLTLILLIKIGCAGLFTAIFLRCTFRQNSLSAWQTGMTLAVFSSLYALCAFTLGYFWNIMWFDSFALLPLVMAGLLALMRDGKYLLYIGALALAVFANFYIGFFVCVSVAMVFFAYSFLHRLSLRTFLSKLGMVAACSALAVGMAAALIFPMYPALQNAYATGNEYPNKVGFFVTSFFEILGNFIAFTPPTFILGLPNLYSGMVSVMLIGVFAVSPKIALREKLVFIGAVVFLVISSNHSVLDYVMHGFYFVSGMPSRYTFLISFMLVVMAYRAFLLTDNMTRQTGIISLIAMGVCAVLFLLSAVFGPQRKSAIIISAVICFLYLALLLFFWIAKTERLRTVVKATFLLVIIAELFFTADIGINASYISRRSEYPYNYDKMQELLELRNQAELPDTSLPDGKTVTEFYRTEMIPPFISNDAFLYNYNGISFFSSTMDGDVLQFVRNLGMPGIGLANKFFYYHETSPLINSFLNMRYMIIHGGFPADRGQFWDILHRIDTSMLAENIYYLPLGFMVSEGVAAYRRHPRNPFLSQNDLFRRATGLDGSLFTVTDFSTDTPAAWDYEMPSDSMLYALFISSDDFIKVGVSVNGTFIRSIIVRDITTFLSAIGRFSKGDIVSFIPESGSLMYAGCFNSGLFEQGYALLADEVLNLTHFSETKVNGTVTALKDGILYTSIPGKNWNVYVDGEKSELLLIDNTMAAVRLSKGTHEVEFRYLNKSFVAGVIISLVSLAIFIMLLMREYIKKRKPVNNENAEKN